MLSAKEHMLHWFVYLTRVAFSLSWILYALVYNFLEAHI